MVPFPMLPTPSSAERRLYERFLEDLDEAYVCYHSVDWVMAGPDGPIQGEADFVVAHAEDGVLVLEVKGGGLSYDPASRRWSQAGLSGRHQLDEDPFHQARDEMHSLVRILKAQPGWDRWRPSYGYGLGVPDARYETEAHPGAPAAVVIDRDDMDRLPERVREVMAHWKTQGRRFGAEGMNALALALGQRVEVRLPLGLAFDEDDRKIVELTEDQAWIRAWVMRRRRALVTGPAGSGKTLLAVEIARRLTMAGNRTLLTCFNRRIAEYLRRTTEGLRQLQAVHFHRLCFEMAQRAGLPMPGGQDQPDGSPFFEHDLPALLMDAAARLGPQFDVIVVDEAQDFRDWWWPALLATHIDPDHGPLYLFADDNQNLYGSDTGTFPVGPDDVCPSLPANVRNTRAIHEFVSVFYRGDTVPAAKGPEGRAVTILAYRDEEDLAHLLGVVLENLVTEEGVPVDDIVVLTPSRKAKSQLRRGGQAGRFRLSEDPLPGEVLATTVHSFKGLESRVVILAEVGERHEEDLERYLYVGGSRARVHLIVLATERVAHRLRDLVGVSGP
jgi:AAA domain/UvrD-like helicase C-terminal domain/Nuclease-related domain